MRLSIALIIILMHSSNAYALAVGSSLGDEGLQQRVRLMYWLKSEVSGPFVGVLRVGSGISGFNDEVGSVFRHFGYKPNVTSMSKKKVREVFRTTMNRYHFVFVEMVEVDEKEEDYQTLLAAYKLLNHPGVGFLKTKDERVVMLMLKVIKDLRDKMHTRGEARVYDFQDGTHTVLFKLDGFSGLPEAGGQALGMFSRLVFNVKQLEQAA